MCSEVQSWASWMSHLESYRCRIRLHKPYNGVLFLNNVFVLQVGWSGEWRGQGTEQTDLLPHTGASLFNRYNIG